MNISLTPELEEYVTTQLKSGHYRSSSEVIRVDADYFDEKRERIRQTVSDLLTTPLQRDRS